MALDQAALQLCTCVECMAHHQADQATNAIADKYCWRIHKLCHEVHQLVPPQLRRIVQQGLVRAPKPQQVNGVHLHRSWWM